MGFDKCILPCIQHYNIIENSFTVLKNPLCFTYSTLPCELLRTTDLFTIFIVLSFPKCNITGIIQYVAFLYWLLSTSNMHLRFTHVFLWPIALSFFFLLLNSINFMDLPHYVYPFSYWRTCGCFQFLIIINKAMLNIYWHIVV